MPRHIFHFSTRLGFKARLGKRKIMISNNDQLVSHKNLCVFKCVYNPGMWLCN